MAKVTIYISLNPKTKKLHLEDSEGHSGDAPSFFTDVNRGDVIVWELTKNSGIEDLTDIRAKDGYFNILKDGAPKKNGNGEWIGHVKDDAAGKDSYDIDYLVDGKPFSEDPEIKVPPGNGNG